MGSGSQRRNGDVINVKPRKAGSGGTGGGRGESNNLCPATLKIELSGAGMKDGAHLRLKVNVDHVDVLSGARAVQQLEGQRWSRILQCLNDGEEYEGRVRVFRGKTYGEFKKTT